MSDVFTELPVGTILRSKGAGLVRRIRVETMSGDWANVYYIRKDGARHRGILGWSGSLRKTSWEVES